MTLGASGTEIVGVIVGAVILFTLVSAAPVVIARIRRRHNARQQQQPEMRSNDTYPSFRCPDNGPMPMQQVFVERWLEQQYAPSSTESYSHDICAICLSSLGLRSSRDSLPMPPEAAWIPVSHSYTGYDSHDDRRSVSPRVLEEGRPTRTNSEIRVLNSCGHAFHSACLASSFQYGRYRCPICQAAYFPS
ncbi:uncharacterized protein EURHEDRAFT_410530 [Aspergillus ruber CBS 135680]|uniref:RING-type domain-containing protein n=1 Tax=Aspergillus ruber (strain CBS 135680) TaxID=1388766 RepID=A0A017SKA1_ASPRC|nr:uncharacterized protein EURHEDRAFT_410530 [Aspergillus ruber CBS 135680]EYE96750.1 hypothetical protein EURHEDRAFT_410530 [Aspergillus ruber CBS 135680]